MRVPGIVPGLLAAASILLLVASFVPGRGGEWVYLLAAPLFPVLLIRLGLGRRRGMSSRSRRVLWGLGGLLLISSVGIRGLDGVADPPWLLGVPASAVLMAIGLVLLPLFLVGFGFAATCEDDPSHVNPESRDGSGER